MKILIEISDGELKLLSQKEYDELNKSDEDFDGFHGWRLMGEVEKGTNLSDINSKSVLKEDEYDEIMKQGERLYQKLDKQEDPYAFHKAFEKAQRLMSGSTNVRRFWIAFQNTNNEQIYDREQKIIIWTKEERRINNVTVNLHDWTPLLASENE